MSVMKINRIGAMSVAKIHAVIMAICGLVAGIALILSVGSYSIMALAGALLLMPIIFAIGGFVSGAVMAFVYNLVAGILGGVELELE